MWADAEPAGIDWQIMFTQERGAAANLCGGRQVKRRSGVSRQAGARMVKVSEKPAGRILGIVQQLGNGTTEANWDASALAGQHYLLARARQEPRQQRGVQFIRSRSALDTRAEPGIQQ